MDLDHLMWQDIYIEVAFISSNVQNNDVGVVGVQTISFAIQINICLFKVGSVQENFSASLHRCLNLWMRSMMS